MADAKADQGDSNRLTYKECGSLGPSMDKVSRNTVPDELQAIFFKMISRGSQREDFNKDMNADTYGASSFDQKKKKKKKKPRRNSNDNTRKHQR